MATKKKLTKHMSATQMPDAAGHTHLAGNKAMIQVTVSDREGRNSPIEGAQVCVNDEKQTQLLTKVTDSNGEAVIEVDPGIYDVTATAFGATDDKWEDVDLQDGGCEIHTFKIPLGFDLEWNVCRDNARQASCPELIREGDVVRIQTSAKHSRSFLKQPIFELSTDVGTLRRISDGEAYLETAKVRGPVKVTAVMRQNPTSTRVTIEELLTVIADAAQSISGGVSVTLGRTATAKTSDMPLWTVIRASTEAISFNNYKDFVDGFVCTNLPVPTANGIDCSTRSLPFPGVDAYSLVKCATEVFLMTNCGVVLNSGFDFNNLFNNSDITLLEEQARFGREIDSGDLNSLWTEYLVPVNGNKTLPYLELIRGKLGDVPLKGTSATVANCYGILQEKLTKPCLLELIWSYWHEEGMLVQTMKAISMRFQNKRGRADLDPMMRFDIDPLRPLGNLLWGYIQDEQHRLTILRRAYEYDHHYGISLQGRAVPSLRQTDSRSKFLEAFHNLLYLCSVFHVSDDDTTVIADGFPVMNGIREVHVLLAEGAHNQFGDLPSTARQEMLIEQWLLARGEMREFLGGRIMVPYSEPWMDRVDTVKRIQGWTDSNISDFHYLAVYGEQILLSIRYGDWTNVNDPTQAANWARYWRPEIQSYVHSYRAVTGVDLTQDTTESRQVSQRYAQPSVHLRRRLDYQLASKR